jgi:hypothetical protein
MSQITKVVELEAGVKVEVKRASNRDRSTRDTLYRTIGFPTELVDILRQDEFCRLVAYTVEFEGLPGYELPNIHDPEEVKLNYEIWLDLDADLTEKWIQAVDQLQPRVLDGTGKQKPTDPNS